MRIRTLFISDLHLGNQYASVRELLDFLSTLKDERRPERIYIIGDFIDGWKIKRNWCWSNESNRLIRKLLGFVKKGTKLYYVAGNHDDFMREFIKDFHVINFGDIYIGDEFVHTTANGERLLVVHGDMFDMVAQYAKWLCKLGDIGYSIMLMANRAINQIRRLFGLEHWSLSSVVKQNVKHAVNYISDFEECLMKYAREKGCTGCVCGHIHSAAIRRENGFLYVNSGDWMESCTAIVEDHSGNLTLYKHHEATAEELPNPEQEICDDETVFA